jgi:hypothetical protein
MEQGIEKVIVADEIRKWHHVFKRDGELFEIRLLGDTTYGGIRRFQADVIQLVQVTEHTHLCKLRYSGQQYETQVPVSTLQHSIECFQCTAVLLHQGFIQQSLK